VSRLRAAAPPALVGAALLLAWEAIVRARDIPPYLVPAPSLVLRTLATDWPTLYPSLLVTLAIALSALVAATVVGVGLAVLFAQSAWIERGFLPWAVVLQVTPMVAIAPLIIIWVKEVWLALLVCAWLVAFFPIVSSTTLGLRSADHRLLDLFQLHGASRRQVLWYVRLPSALPYVLSGLRISGGLALIGAVVAEFVAGTGGTRSGLASRILESGYTLQIPRMFAALLLIALSGIAIHAALAGLQHLCLRRWHESARDREPSA
jgi:NitT/TauT family transport system permease protein